MVGIIDTGTGFDGEALSNGAQSTIGHLNPVRRRLSDAFDPFAFFEVCGYLLSGWGGAERMASSSLPHSS